MEYYADCFGELETESESSSHGGEAVDENTGTSGRANLQAEKEQSNADKPRYSMTSFGPGKS